MGRETRRGSRRFDRSGETALSRRCGRASAGGGYSAGAMLFSFLVPSPWAWLDWLLGVSASRVLPAGVRDAEELAALHATAFGRGWSAEEFERLLIEHSVVADRAMAGERRVGIVVLRPGGAQGRARSASGGP